MNERLDRFFDFIIEVDRLKQVQRQTLLCDGSRFENDAEHSWHFALMAMLLTEYAATPPLDLLRVLKMILIHDLVEIDAGDTFAYDAAGHADKRERETRAAERIFALLPEDAATELRALWDEFEAGDTPEARYALALDRLQPILQNCCSAGAAWRRHGISAERVIARNQSPILAGAPQLWRAARARIDEAARRAYLSSESTADSP